MAWHYISCRLQTSLDYTVTAQFLAWMGYSVIEKGGLASALKGKMISQSFALLYP